MEHLTKQQIVLLTLFTSFVTSIATGIVTVALVDQNPTSVGGTINNVIERTIEEVVPSSTTTDAQSAAALNAAGTANTTFSNPADQIAYVTAAAQKSIVRITLNNTATGLGVVVASSGIIVSDKSAVEVYGNYVAVTSDGRQYPLQLLQSQNDGDIVFLLAGAPAGSASGSTGVLPPGTLTAATFAPLVGKNAPRLAETVIALSGTSTPSVDEGIIEKINDTTDANGNVTASSSVISLHTNIDSSDVTLGASLFDANGNILGLKTLSSGSGDFYPIGYLQSVIPTL